MDPEAHGQKRALLLLRFRISTSLRADLPAVWGSLRPACTACWTNLPHETHVLSWSMYMGAGAHPGAHLSRCIARCTSHISQDTQLQHQPVQALGPENFCWLYGHLRHLVQWVWLGAGNLLLARFRVGRYTLLGPQLPGRQHSPVLEDSKLFLHAPSVVQPCACGESGRTWSLSPYHENPHLGRPHAKTCPGEALWAAKARGGLVMGQQNTELQLLT